MNKHLYKKFVSAVALVLACVVVALGFKLSGGWMESAQSKSASVSVTQVTVSSACSMTANVTSTHHATLIPGVYSGAYTADGATPYADGIGSTTLTSFCNDSDGYAIYAIGYTGETDGVNTMIGDATGLTIATGTATSGNTSQWAMKLAKVTDSSTSYLPNNLTIVDGFDAFHAVPNAYTKVASYSSQTDSTFGLGSKLTATYAVYVQPDQTVDTYVGKVKYTLVHPSTNDTSSYIVNFYANGGTGTMNSQKITRGQATALTSNSFTAPTGKTFISWNTAPDGSGTSYADGEQVTNLADAGDTITLYAQWGTLYDVVASMSKGKQTAAQLQAAIIVPTSADRLQDTSNSGVYEYDPAVFGVASDASNDYKIYYYRGVLENSTSSYGSNGSAVTYPNYVILQSGSSKATTDTCWRIVRTTGSGGVKMIYNGKWTGSTCANVRTDVQLNSMAFSGDGSTNRQIVRVGYTYNRTYATNTAQSGTIAQIFGTNSDPSVNNTRSSVKTYIEDTWYANNMTAWTNILEPSAGYCNDRTMNTTMNWTSPLAESSTIAATYGTSGVQTYYFGVYPRNYNSAQPPSLTCAKYSTIDRSVVDLYRYVANSAGVGNELKYPVALLAADEISFAGSGKINGDNGSSSNFYSFLGSGSYFWSLSPLDRQSDGKVSESILYEYGSINGGIMDNIGGVRPAISLVSGTIATSGSGTATDPWVVMAP